MVDADHIRLPPVAAEPDVIIIERPNFSRDGPTRRLTIRRGDTVDAYFSCGNVQRGKVIEICHVRQQVCISGDSEGRGEWFPVEYVFHVRRST